MLNPSLVMSIFSALRQPLIWGLFLSLAGCGYTIRSTSMKSPVLEKAGIHRIYLAPVVNNSYKAGAELVVYNALQKKILGQGELRLVESEEYADAIISASVNGADYSSVSFTSGSNLEPKMTTGSFRNYVVASIYSANLSCAFSLTATERSRVPLDGKGIWSATFSRNKSFQANNQLGVLGTTSAIINDSEFERALADLADGMMVDVYESLLSMF